MGFGWFPRNSGYSIIAKLYVLDVGIDKRYPEEEVTDGHRVTKAIFAF